MSSIAGLFGKIRRKGWRGTLRILCERFIYRRWELVMLERPLDIAPPMRLSAQRWRHTRISPETLPKLEKYFSRYLPAVRELLARGLRGDMFLNDEGDAIGMMWVSFQDYYDNHLYHCWVRLPPGCMYQFAGEIAPPWRGVGLPLLGMCIACEEFPQLGYHAVRSLVDTSNLPALTLHIRLGFREIGEVTHAYRLLRFLHFSRTRPYHEPRFLHLRKKGSRLLPQE
ncbi:MAG: hypothetical protein LBQ81_01440 [Zoogloeaceae bacterium]|jgi:RimJ/RimL family protein N-acetyltransferase|nr:hypothetical protein [Zoogloeaceae bacterium]